MIVVKTIVRTLMFVVVVLFCVSTLHFYKIQANESLPTRPNFEHTNNQQFIDNVNQCIDYIYFYYIDPFLIYLSLDLSISHR